MVQADLSVLVLQQAVVPLTRRWLACLHHCEPGVVEHFIRAMTTAVTTVRNQTSK